MIESNPVSVKTQGKLGFLQPDKIYDGIETRVNIGTDVRAEHEKTSHIVITVIDYLESRVLFDEEKQEDDPVGKVKDNEEKCY